MKAAREMKCETREASGAALPAPVLGDPPVAYPYSPFEKLENFFPCVRQKFAPKRNLFAGPFAGEFGYELMQWQGFVRARRPRYKSVHVLTYPGRDYLYEDCQVHYHEIDLKKAGYGYGLLDPAIGRKMVRESASRLGLKDYDIFDPSLLCTRYHRGFWGQEFRLFHEAPSGPGYDVVFHFRAVQKEGYDDKKNYLPVLADEVAAQCLRRGLSIACIGHPSYSYCPGGCDDYRNIELRETIAAISSAWLVAGENSGPMHLANLCGKATVIWAQDQWRIDYSLRWNPFRVPIYVATNDTCQPDPAIVAEAIERALSDLEERSGGFTKPVYTLPAQPIALY